MDKPFSETQTVIGQMKDITGSDAPLTYSQPSTQDIIENIDNIISSDSSAELNINKDVTSVGTEKLDSHVTHIKQLLTGRKEIKLCSDKHICEEMISADLMNSANTSVVNINQTKRHADEEVCEFSSKILKFVPENKTDKVEQSAEELEVGYSEKHECMEPEFSNETSTSEYDTLENKVKNDNKSSDDSVFMKMEQKKSINEDARVCNFEEMQEKQCKQTPKKTGSMFDENTQEYISTKNTQETVPSLVKSHSNEVIKHETEEDLCVEYFSEDSFMSKPNCAAGAWTDFDSLEDNYLRGCKWSPDGTCILTNSNDNCLRIFNLPEIFYSPDSCHSNTDVTEIHSVLKMKESELVYDYCWFPLMRSSDPATCCLASTTRDTPVHLWDAFSGELRCSYRAFNQMDEVVAAHSLAFSLDGQKLYTGFNKIIRVFDVSQPGRECQSRLTHKKHGQPGIISCFSMCPLPSRLYAAGSYSRAIALYDDRSADMVCMFKGQQGGVTHIMFSPDGTKLYSGGRKDPEILCWDLRNPGQILFVALREVVTNQRIYFDLDSCGHYLVSGNNDGYVTVWKTNESPKKLFSNVDPVLEPKLKFRAHDDAVNGVSVHPSLQITATSSGQRHFNVPGDSDESDTDTSNISLESTHSENSLKIWTFNKQKLPKQ